MRRRDIGLAQLVHKRLFIELVGEVNCEERGAQDSQFTSVSDLSGISWSTYSGSIFARG